MVQFPVAMAYSSKMPNIAETLATMTPERAVKALELIDYMLGDASKAGQAEIVLSEMSERIVAAGVPLDRSTYIFQLLHAEATASALYWERGKEAYGQTFPYAQGTRQKYGASPAAIAHETGEWVVLWLPETADEEFNIVRELKDDGFIHYVMMPVFMANGLTSTFSFATRDKAGFSEADFAYLRAVFPALAACQEILTTHQVMNDVLRMYVGEDAQKRIVAGDVHRGDVMRIRSAILFADMRNYTGLAGAMEAEEVTAMLNDYFDCIVPAVESRGGEVLKFMGDGILVIFREEGDVDATCRCALDAAKAGLDAVDHYRGRPKFRAGIALHYGEVGYGNIGSGLRLDYTVVGRDVNMAARLADLCGALDAPLLVSETFCTHVGPAAFQVVGAHQLKGLDAPVQVFAPLAQG